MSMRLTLQPSVKFVGCLVIAVVKPMNRKIVRPFWVSLAFTVLLVLPSTGLEVAGRTQPSVAASRGPEWAWFRAVSTGTGWWVVQGKADVRISRDRFEADLRDSADSTFVSLSLRGSTSKGLTTVRVHVAASDRDDFELSGRLRRMCWGKGGREVFIFTDGIDVVGLERELDGSSSCTPA
jgi:hypothetical protein